MGFNEIRRLIVFGVVTEPHNNVETSKYIWLHAYDVFTILSNQLVIFAMLPKL